MSGPRLYSRHSYCERLRDKQGRLYLSDRTPFRYQALADNRTHLVRQGDTLQTLADRYFGALVGAAQLWWVIADFQPNGGIHDPTIDLAPGTTLVIPSMVTLQTLIFSEARRDA